eukprot:2446767-Amphidinium_carterae.1
MYEQAIISSIIIVVVIVSVMWVCNGEAPRKAEAAIGPKIWFDRALGPNAVVLDGAAEESSSMG